jgi:hypothetical protein
MKTGDLVLCVCDFSKFVNHYQLDVNYPKAGKYYLIRESKRSVDGKELVKLDEIVNDKTLLIEGEKIEISFEGNCFVNMPLPDISELTNILNS